MYEALCTKKYEKNNNTLVEKNKDTNINPDFEQNQYSRIAENIYKWDMILLDCWNGKLIMISRFMKI